VKRGEEYWFRCWSTITDSYITTETRDLDALRDLLLEDELERTKESFLNHWPQRIERALDRGTSGLGKRQMDEWDLSQAEKRKIWDEFCDTCEHEEGCEYYPPEYEDDDPVSCPHKKEKSDGDVRLRED